MAGQLCRDRQGLYLQSRRYRPLSASAAVAFDDRGGDVAEAVELHKPALVSAVLGSARGGGRRPMSPTATPRTSCAKRLKEAINETLKENGEHKASTMCSSPAWWCNERASHPIRSPGRCRWAQPFLPPVARGDKPDDPSAMMTISARCSLATAARALSALFGLPVSAAPAGPPPRRWQAGAARRAGARRRCWRRCDWAVIPTAPWRRAARRWRGMARAIAAALDAVGGDAIGRRLHAAGAIRSRICCAITPPAPVNGHAQHLGAAMRAGTAAATDRGAAPRGARPADAAARRALPPKCGWSRSLLPLRAGTVLAIDAAAEMPLILGRHCIGRATVTPPPDGRQQAEIVAIAVDRIGGTAHECHVTRRRCRAAARPRSGGRSGRLRRDFGAAVGGGRRHPHVPARGAGAAGRQPSTRSIAGSISRSMC